MFEKLFQLKENGTDIRTEILAGFTTFLTLSYIIFVNPHILADAGMDSGAIFVATCLTSAIACLIMALYANYPFALAPGMGINAYFTYDVVIGAGVNWQVALGAVFIAGLLFVALTLSHLREKIITSIPRSQKMAISAGIGFFLIIIALQNAGMITADKITMVKLGDLAAPGVLLAVAGFVLMVGLESRRITGGILIALLAIPIAGIMLDITPAQGIFSMPPSLAPTFFQMDIAGAFDTTLIVIILAFLFVLMFDATGSLIGLGNRAGFLDKEGNLPRMRQALVTDSAASVVSAALGTSPTTVYIESATGIKAGGRTGLTALVVAALMVLALFLSPLAETVPIYATAPALLFVGCLMARSLTEIDWEDVTEYVPAIITALAMPLTFSITSGIGFGFIAYVAIKLIAGKRAQVSLMMAILAAAFVFKFAYLQI